MTGRLSYTNHAQAFPYMLLAFPCMTYRQQYCMEGILYLWYSMNTSPMTHMVTPATSYWHQEPPTVIMKDYLDYIFIYPAIFPTSQIHWAKCFWGQISHPSAPTFQHLHLLNTKLGITFLHQYIWHYFDTKPILLKFFVDL